MKAFFRAARKINLGYTVNWLSGSPTVLKNVLNKMRKIKHVAPKKKDFSDNPESFCFQ